MNRNVLVTGATSGIGKACAEKFAEAKDNLIITGRRTDRLEELSEQLHAAYNVQVHTLQFDVQDRAAVFSSIASLPPEWDHVDILINNAGLALGRDYFEEANMDDWDTMLNTNVHGLIYVSRAVLPLLMKKRGSHIVNVGSIAGKQVYEKGNVYCGSKAAVDAISHSMRIDLLRHNIKVTAIHPGAVETEFGIVRFKGDTATAAKAYEGLTPLTGSDIADVIFYTCNLPAHVCINDLVITPLQQADAIYFNRTL